MLNKNFTKYLFLLIFALFLTSWFIHKQSSTTLGDYNGISNDGRWEVNFKVYQHKNRVLLKGELICLDESYFRNFSEKTLEDDHITIYKKNGKVLNGAFLSSSIKKTILINYVDDDGSYYDKMVINIDSYITEIKIKKIKNRS